jgi:Uma2 family endonuclease
MSEDLDGYDDDMTMLVADPVVYMVTEEYWDEFEPPEAYRAEIIRGELVLTPAPSYPHARAQSRLFLLIHAAAPADLEALVVLEWRHTERGHVAMAPQSDVVVVQRGQNDLTERPVLWVEVLSPSDRRRLESGVRRIEGKRLDFAEQGLADYLEIDLNAAVPTAIRYELHDGALVEVDRAEGDKRLAADRPFAYELVPAELVEP